AHFNTFAAPSPLRISRPDRNEPRLSDVALVGAISKTTLTCFRLHDIWICPSRKFPLFTRPAFRDSANAVLTSVVVHPNLTLRARQRGAIPSTSLGRPLVTS